MAEKPDAERIRQHIDSLKNADWLDTARAWWPDYLFHLTDINNAANILKTGYLISRERIKATNTEYVDAASHQVLERTSDRWKTYVRFYFRPRTPMLYNIEGIRPVKSHQSKPHCPVPVYLLFDSKAVLSMPDSSFTTGNLARANTKVYASAADFVNLPFQKIYHDEPTNEMNKDEITNRRHTEVIVPDQIDLTHLRRIWCRSEAEYATLRHLLGPAWWQWQDKITRRPVPNLFNRSWTYVDQVVLDSQSIDIYFHEAFGAYFQGPFQIRIELIDKTDSSDKQYIWSQSEFMVTQNVLPLRENVLTLQLSRPFSQYEISIYLDEALCYAGRFISYTDPDDIPF